MSVDWFSRWPGGRKSLFNLVGEGNLFGCQSAHGPACFVGRQRTSALMHASRSLVVASVVAKPKVPRGCDFCLFQQVLSPIAHFPGVVRPVGPVRGLTSTDLPRLLLLTEI